MRLAASAFLLALCLAALPAAAQSDSNKEAFKKTEKGMGRLLEAMGSEVKKMTADKKDGKKKPPAKAAEASK
jgi:hypothetical protein